MYNMKVWFEKYAPEPVKESCGMHLPSEVIRGLKWTGATMSAFNLSPSHCDLYLCNVDKPEELQKFIEMHPYIRVEIEELKPPLPETEV